MKALQAGECRNQVTFQKFVTTSQDSSGHPVGSWTTQFSMMCKVEEGSGREVELARQTHAEARYVIRGFAPVGVIKREWRAIKDGGALNLIDVADPFGTRREVLIIAKEWVE